MTDDNRGQDTRSKIEALTKDMEQDAEMGAKFARKMEKKSRKYPK